MITNEITTSGDKYNLQPYRRISACLFMELRLLINRCVRGRCLAADSPHLRPPLLLVLSPIVIKHTSAPVLLSEADHSAAYPASGLPSSASASNRVASS